MRSLPMLVAILFLPVLAYAAGPTPAPPMGVMGGPSPPMPRGATPGPTEPQPQTQQVFVPFMVRQDDIAQLDAMMMNNAPRNYGQVINDWIGGMEGRAHQDLAKAEAAAKAKAESDAKQPEPKQ